MLRGVVVVRHGVVVVGLRRRVVRAVDRRQGDALPAVILGLLGDAMEIWRVLLRKKIPINSINYMKRIHILFVCCCFSK